MTRRGAQTLVALMLLAATQLTGGAAAASPARDAAGIDGLVALGRLGEAVSACEALPEDAWTPPMKAACARAALGLGDRFAELGQTALARPRWLQALAWDPTLADDPAVLARVSGGNPPPADTAPLPADAAPTTPANEPVAPADPAPSETVAPADSEPDAHADAPHLPSADPTATPSEDPAPETPKATSSRPAADPVRASRHLSLGLGTGYTDGLLGLTLGWLSGGRFCVEIGIGLLYPTFDVRARWYVLDDALTPTLGAGLLVPLSPIDRGGAGLGAMEAIYELAESFHVDIGLAWMVIPGLDLGASVSFVTPFDQVHPDTVVFFPQLNAHAAWRF